MAKFTAAARKFIQGEEGATMVEYALMVALIAVACILAVLLATWRLRRMNLE